MGVWMDDVLDNGMSTTAGVELGGSQAGNGLYCCTAGLRAAGPGWDSGGAEPIMAMQVVPLAAGATVA